MSTLKLESGLYKATISGFIRAALTTRVENWLELAKEGCMRYIGLLLCIVICCIAMTPAFAETTKPLERGTIVYADPENTETAVIIPGPQGPQGPRGFTGPRGPAGTKGDTGVAGPQGEPGKILNLLQSGWFWLAVALAVIGLADLIIALRRTDRELRTATLATATGLRQLTEAVTQIGQREETRYRETSVTLARHDERLIAIERMVHPTRIAIVNPAPAPTPAPAAPVASTP